MDELNSNLKQQALDAAADAMARATTESESDRIMVAEGFKQIFKSKKPSDAEPQYRYVISRTKEGESLRVEITDLLLVRSYADSINFLGDGSCVWHNIRTGETRRMEPAAAAILKLHLNELLPGWDSAG